LHTDYFLENIAESKIVYTKNNYKKIDKDIQLLEYSLLGGNQHGIEFMTMNMKIKMKMLGVFNAGNAMNAIAVGLALGLDGKTMKAGLEKIIGVAGRLEKIDAGQKFIAIVDYAFEPKALSKLYETLDLIPHKNIVHVLGSTGGGRDISRRPRLGQIAGENAKYVVVTNEDPYDDDPEIIIDQVALGAENAGKKLNYDLFKILDREEAIKKAVNLTKEKDILILTGKGNEQAICIANGKKIPWDDREKLRYILKK
jgi:UDP-N-acetylmuramoyl-L-alanyl-D-glutamate--2,6-diaminopimelate ligase